MNRSSQEPSDSRQNADNSRNRRAYKACLHCRSRKAKCDLGDIDAPSKPPCARCKREQRECVFAPSFRGGKIVKKASDSLETPSVGHDEDTGSRDAEALQTALNQDRGMAHISTPTSNDGIPGPLSVTSFNDNSDLDLDHDAGCSSSEGPPHRKKMRMDSSSSIKNNNPHHHGDTMTSRSRSATVDRDVVDPQSLATTSLRNPTDALNLLALAADVDRASKNKGRGRNRGRKRGADGVPVEDRDDDDTAADEEREHDLDGSPSADRDGVGGGENEQPNNAASHSPRGTHHHNHHHHHHTRTHHHHHARPPSPPSLATYELIRQGVLTPGELSELMSKFFERVHIIFPMMPYHRIPRTESQLARFAEEDTYLITAIVVITSRQERWFVVHDKSWNYMQSLINELILGKAGSVGAVEALLLLSENLPRRQASATEDEEHRMSWMLVGMAVRLGYMLGLDQKTLPPTKPGLAGDETPLSNGEDPLSEHEQRDRERLAWTYCYIFDRSISIRSGKAFWSRGPNLCFQRTQSGMFNSATEYFPSLRPIAGLQDDFASVLQAYTELTQTMASAHDVLYPSKDRTISLVRLGEYHKYLDEFARSIDGFKLNWEGKVWETPVVNDCVRINFHYLRLYIYAFAFQAHVQRSTTTNEDGRKVADTVIFPRGPMGSPDARFILEAIDAATELLKICVEKLYPSRALAYLPWRFFLYFSYAGVFLLKAIFVGAVVPQDQRNIVQLIKKLIVFLANASSDEHHSGVRYARLLNGLLRVFSRGVDGVTSQLTTPKKQAIALPTETSPLPGRTSTTSTLSITTEHLDTARADNTVKARERPIIPLNGNVRGRMASVSNAATPHIPADAPSSHTPVNVPSHRASRSMGSQPLHHNGPTSDDTMFASTPHTRQLTRIENQIYAPSNVGYASGSNLAPSQHQQLYTSPHTPHPHLTSQHLRQTNQIPHPQSPVNTFHNHPTIAPSYEAVFPSPNTVNTPAPSVPPASAANMHGMNFHFDLNWPPMEVDGLAQMLGDEHSLDSEFWMSLPNQAASWQTWPAGTANSSLT